MWIIFLIIGVIGIIIYNSNTYKKDLNRLNKVKGTPELTPEAKNIMSEFHKDFTMGQRYAYYNLLSTISETHANSSQIIKNQVNYTLRQTAQFLNVSPDQAEAYLRINGVEELCKQLASIPKGAQLDSIISTAYGMASAAQGYIYGVKANEYAIYILLQTFERAGISEDDIVSSVEKIHLFASKFI